MNVRNIYIAICIVTTGLISCNDLAPKTHGAIKLGDPATIVTETDPVRLQDLVTDLKPDIPPAAPRVTDTPKTVALTPLTGDTAKKTATTSVAATPPPHVPVITGPGLTAAFKEITVHIPGLSAKLSGKADLTKANGAVYTWQQGRIAGNQLKIGGGNVTKIAQRYQTVIVLKGKNGNLPLEELSETTDWKLMPAGNNYCNITGLSENELQFADADNRDIRNALQKSARGRRLSGKKTQEWLSVMGNPRTANQKPLMVVLRSVMWKIDGKDAAGKMFSKQIRIDIPM